jgi:hypothetical protein
MRIDETGTCCVNIFSVLGKMATGLINIVTAGATIVTAVVGGLAYYVVSGVLEHELYAIPAPTNLSDGRCELYLKVHDVLYSKNYHCCLVVVAPDSMTADEFGLDDKIRELKAHQFPGYSFFTIGAGDVDGKLTSDYNRKQDVKLNIAVEMNHLCYQSVAQVKNIIRLNEYYAAHDKPPYALFTKKSNGTYNSNSFARGLLDAAGIDYSHCPPQHKVPGWEKPLLKTYFWRTRR